MLHFTKIRLSDAVVTDIRMASSVVEIDYIDWQDQKHTLAFQNTIACCTFSPHGRTLSHGEVAEPTDDLQALRAIAEEDGIEKFSVSSLVDAWSNTKVVRVVAEFVTKVE